MKLCVAELGRAGATTINQVVTPSRNVIVEAIRPHIYRHNQPSGSLSITIYDQSNTLVATSNSVNITSIGTLNYYHGYYPFMINAYLAKGQSYTVKLNSSGYTFSEPAYCGWVNGLDLGKYPITTVPSGAYHYPLDYEFWERTP